MGNRDSPIARAGASTVPYMSVLFIPVLLGIRSLYPWARPEAVNDPNIQTSRVPQRAVLRNPIHRVLRDLFLYARLLTRLSREQDLTGDDRLMDACAPSAHRGWLSSR